MNLPSKSSECIRYAVGNCYKVLESKDYKMNLVYWHRPSDDGRCRVCFAGATFAFHLNDPKRDVYTLSSLSVRDSEDGLFSEETVHKLYAMNAFRYLNNIESSHGLHYFYGDRRKELSKAAVAEIDRIDRRHKGHRDVVCYYRELFLPLMKEFADVLEKEGL